MKMTDLKDVTFQIPVRIDSQTRLDNLNLILEFLTSNFDTNIVVLEADIVEKVTRSMSTVKKIFVEDKDDCFYRTAYLNYLTSICETPYVAVWDTDVLVRPQQISKAVELLRGNKADFIYPYDGKFHYAKEILSNFYMEFKDLHLLEFHLDSFTTHLEYPAVGGGFIVNRLKYMEAGMENPHFKGWGPEDKERMCRMEILGNRIKWIMDGPMIHLYHPRLGNSSYQGNTMRQLQNEYLKVSNMSPSELRRYINGWSKDMPFLESSVVYSESSK